MADIFISYKKGDKWAVQPLVQALRSAGLTVWWDQDIKPGEPWEKTIERELHAAKCTIVAWSPDAVVSDNVKAEARWARDAGKLIQLFIQPCNPPLFFGERQGVDLSGWNGVATDNRFVAVLTAARAVVAGKTPPAGVGYARKKRPPVALFTGIFAGLASLIALIANMGGARDALCGLNALSGACLQYGLMAPPSAPVGPVQSPPPTATEIAAQARAALLAKIPGVWGNDGSDIGGASCATRVTYSTEREGTDDFIVVKGDGDFESRARVTMVDGTSITTRSVPPAKDVGQIWELSVESDRLHVVDAQGIVTPLVRCGP